MVAIAALFAITTARATIERELAFKGAGGFELHGTFVSPVTKTKAPCVLLLPGSGPTDRDGNQLPGLVSNLLKQIADRLLSQRVASYRFDKRSIPGRYMEYWPKEGEAYNSFMDFNNFVEDAKLAFLTLKAQPEVDPGRAGVVAHSEGTLLALKFCSELRPSQRPKTLVLIGAPGRTVGVVLRQQLQELFERQKLTPDKFRANMADVDRGIDQVSKDATAPKDMPNTPLFRALFQPRTTKMMRGLFRTDPISLAREYAGPVLLVIGEYDQDASPIEDTPRLEKAFASRKNGEVRVFTAAHGSHALKETPDRDHETYAGPVIPAAMDAISEWVKTHL